MSSRNSYGANLVNYMLTKEQVFKQFRSYYYLLYQCLVPNTREALSLLVQHYSVPKDFERSILSGENPRVCNQGLLNYLLIKLRTDKNFVKFWTVLNLLVNESELRAVIGKIMKDIHHPIQSIMHHHDTTLDTDNVFPLEQRALSVIDSDDDYCISYIVTMVDVRSCARPPRSHDQQHISQMSTPPRSLDQTYINEYTRQQKSLCPQSSASVGFKILQSHYSVLVRSMPDDYMNTVSQLERHLTGDHIGSILECRDVFTANQRILDCLIEQINTKEGLLDFCEQLSSITNTPALTAVIENVMKECIELITATSEATNVITTITTAITHTATNTTTATTSSSVSVVTPTTVQITSSQNVSSESHYSVLVKSMPDDHKNTVSQLERHLTGDHIGSILECRDVFTANQRILDCLIEQINTKEGLLDFCNWLSTITDAPALTTALKEFKKDVIAAIEASSSAASNFNVHNFIHFNKSDAFIDVELSQFGPKGIATIKKHCNNLLMSLPEDHMITLQRFYDIEIFGISDEIVDHIVSSTNSQSSNELIFRTLIYLTENDNQLLGLSFVMERLATGGLSISDCPNIELFRNDCLQIIKEKMNVTVSANNINVSTVTTNTPHTTTTTTATATTVTGICAASNSQQSNAPDRKLKSGKPRIKDLQNIITLNYAAQWMIIGTQLGIDYGFLQGIEASFPSNAFRCCNEMLQKWLQSDCNATWDKICEVVKSPTVSQARQQNDVTELQYQPPCKCPAYHVPRAELLKDICSAILNSDVTPTIGTTVTIRGIGGIGKSTIAKALCHDPLIKKHFVNGFLWVSLTSTQPNLITKLSEIYQTLTGKSAVTDASESLLISRIKALVSSPSCKLLVILDDVWEANDVMMFVDMFSSCKIVMTTRKMDLNVALPPIKCFDVQPMSVDESVKLLTLKIIEVETLDATDLDRIQKLARDLHYWPLLLNLVHGQLHIHCVEWNESPQDGILKVHQKLFDNGLTAFDLSETSRDNAVGASIKASLELLTEDEEIILLFVALSIIGIGMYTFEDVLSAIVKVRSKPFNECTRNLWCHGLIIMHQVKLPYMIEKIPCIGMHGIIAEFITETVPFEFNVMITNKTLEIVDILILDKYFCTEVAANVGQFFLSKADSILIPFLIRLLAIHANYLQAVFIDELNMLTEENFPLVKNSNLIHQTIKFPQVQIPRKIKEDCTTIHSLLAEGKYNVAIMWAKHYFPSKLNYEPIFTTLHTLKKSCKSKLDHDAVNSCISLFKQHFEGCKRLQNKFLLYIIGYKHVQCLVNAAASDDDVKHFLKCAMLYRQ